ncbi:hypothetical protein, partial [uncultured Treponema sp.]|uniref:hypothetical protein n=1 Tax=uncultured Treponema sp. TaxID=162155 RepID=UPI0025F75D99
RMNIAQDIFCVNRKFIFFSKIFHFFSIFFPGGETGESGGKCLRLDRPAPWDLAPRRSAVEWGRQSRQPGAERTAEGYRATEGRQPEKAAHYFRIKNSRLFRKIEL